MKQLLAAILLVCFFPVHSYAGARKDRTVIVISLDGFPAYALDDPRLPIPTLRELAREGAVATSMHPINPTVTWPNHTAMVTGVDASHHDVLFNGLLTHPGSNSPVKIEPWRDKDLMVHAPTVYDAAYHAGLTTAQVDWVAIYGAKTITWQFPERPDPQGKIEQELTASGIVTQHELETFNQSSPAWRDQIWTKAAVEILKQHRPNLLLFHLLDLDGIHHEYGPMGVASMTAMAFLDDRVKEIVDAVQSAGLAQQTDILIVSDHGFRKIHHAIHLNSLLREKGLIQDENGKAHCDAWVVPEGGSAMVYVTNPARRAALVAQLRSLFASVEGVEHVYGQEDYAALGLPRTEQSDQSPDLFLAAKPGYSFSEGTQGNLVTDVSQGGSHGYLNTDPQMQAIFLAWGADVRPGTHLAAFPNLDIAPTIAALLGVNLPGTDGHSLNKILK